MRNITYEERWLARERVDHRLTKSLLMKLPVGMYLVWSSRWSNGIPHDYIQPLKMEITDVNEVTGKDMHNSKEITRLREFRISEIGAISPHSITIWAEKRMDWGEGSAFYGDQRIFFNTYISNNISSAVIEDSCTYIEFSLVGRYSPDTYRDDWKRYKTIVKSNHRTKLNK